MVLQKLDNEKDWKNPAVVKKKIASRSYLIQTSMGQYRRNRRHLKHTRNYQFTSEMNSRRKPTTVVGFHYPTVPHVGPQATRSHSHTVPSPKPTPVPSHRTGGPSTMNSPVAVTSHEDNRPDVPNSGGASKSPPCSNGGPVPSNLTPRQPSVGTSHVSVPASQSTPGERVKTTRSGRVVKQPARFQE
ncbi:hypothetical protein ACOMHN_033620 [Nucella lapillus]